MLNFANAKLSLDELQIAFSLATNDTSDPTEHPLETIQNRVMENTIEHIVDYLEAASIYIKNLPVEYTLTIEDVVNNIALQIASRAATDGLLLGLGDDVTDGHGLNLV